VETKIVNPKARVSGREYSRMDLKATEAMSRRIRRLETIPFWSSSAAGAVMEGPGIDIVGITVGLGGDTVLIYDSTGLPVAEFSADAAGLAAALALAVAGDIVFLQAFTIPGDYTVPDGVCLLGFSRRLSVLTGVITLGVDSSLENLRILRDFADASEVHGVYGPVSGTGYMYDVTVDATQAGSGDVYAVESSGGGSIEAHRCTVRGFAQSGSFGGVGYAGRATAGSMYIFHGSWRGSTDRFTLS